jgi:hypothetical protein
VSAEPDSDVPAAAAQAHEAIDEAEVIDAVPVLGGDPPSPAATAAASPLQRRYGAAAPAVQAAAAAAGGFVAGAAVFGLVQRRQRRAAAPRGQRSPRGRRSGPRGEPAGGVGELVHIVASRSVLLDVHLLAGPGGER